MGQSRPNCELIEDHAAAAYRPKFESGEWSEVAEDLAEQNPQYSEVIKAFISAAGERKASETGPALKVVAA